MTKKGSWLAARLCAGSMVVASLLLAGCSAPSRLKAVPSNEAANVSVLGVTDIRYWGDENSSALVAEGLAAYQRELAAFRAAGNSGPLPPANYLAISGGGENGAFGA